MVLHPKLERFLTDLGLSDPLIAPDPEGWKRIIRGMNQWCSEAEHNEFLLNQTLETLGQSSRQLESKIAEEREKLESVLSAIHDAVCAIDRRGRILFANPAARRLFDYEMAQQGQFSLLDILVANDEEIRSKEDLLRRINAGEMIRDDETILDLSEEKSVPISYIFSPIVKGDIVVGSVCVVRDVTEQKEAADRLRLVNEQLTQTRDQAVEANQAKSIFLANMSHELRTPLNAVIGYTELIREDAEIFGYDEIAPDLSKIHVAAKHLLSLINDILDLSKIEAGRHEIIWETFALADLIGDVASTIGPAAQQKENAFVIDADDSLGMIRADRIKLRQILLNLLSNACKFTQEGEVRLQVQRESTELGDQFVFEITDTGIGVSNEKLQGLFEPFTQADNSTTREYGGTGLGLTITQHFCKMMGGSIEAESEKGKGSTFRVRLPAPLAIGKSEMNAKAFLGELQSPRSNHTVLAIDDSETVHDLLRRQLGRAGYRVVSATSGEEGLRLARTISPSVITLDVMMPGRDGWDILGELKNDEELCRIPVVMLTMVVDRKRGFALGADDYLVKPVSGDKLLETMQRFEVRGSAMKALIVEDDDNIREIMERTMKNAGWATDTAGHGRAALASLEESKADVILLDLMMPEMDGFEFLEELRAHEKWAEIPVVVITARQLSKKEMEQLKLVTERVMRKGNFTGVELVEEVDRLVCQTLPKLAMKS